ncbi:hypothetical protein [Kitasatospora sp. MBT63]|uniref:hypothetical protein n=1 Tax=Kitasatospora sp. MBT63 TaxID=1444768 RepID=UPI00053A0E16|nr:hypothetical protein [Kitasatospora sp. MBT63]
MNEYDRERAHRRSADLSHLKDEVDEKNTEHIDRARQADDARRTDPERDTAEQPPGSAADRR